MLLYGGLRVGIGFVSFPFPSFYVYRVFQRSPETTKGDQRLPWAPILFYGGLRYWGWS